MVVWAWEDGSTSSWVIAGLSVVVVIAVSVLKFQRPGRKLREAGIPMWVLTLAVAAGFVGFFAIAVVGGPIAFVLTIYLFELRKRDGRAWTSTKAALRAVLQSIGIELAGGFVVVVLLLVGIFLF